MTKEVDDMGFAVESSNVILHLNVMEDEDTELKRTTVSIDEVLADMVAIKITGCKQTKAVRNRIVKKWAQEACDDEYYNVKGLSATIRFFALMFIADDKTSGIYL